MSPDSGWSGCNVVSVSEGDTELSVTCESYLSCPVDLANRNAPEYRNRKNGA